MRAEFDVIVIGAGPAGSACALTLARKGVDVLMIEKAKIPGERNVTGGVLYGSFEKNYGLINLVPEFEKIAPLERKIISHEVIILDEPNYQKKECKYYRLTKDSFLPRTGIITMDFETGHDYSILKRPFDRWFSDLAVSEGAFLATGVTVKELLIEDNSVKGIVTTKETIRSNVVIDCSGVTSKFVEQLNLRKPLRPRDLYHGIKKVYRLDESKINERFRVKSHEGKALFFFGKFMKNVRGGAFIYTNKETLSVGTVVSMDSLIQSTTERFNEIGKLTDIQNEFERHPMIAELLDGAELLEYSAHNIPKGYKCILKKPYANGFLVAGDALGAFVKIGPMIDGIRRAIASGIMAAETYVYSSFTGSYNSNNLSRYKELLQPIYEDVDRSGRDSFLTESSFSYNVFPSLVFTLNIGVKSYRFEKMSENTKLDSIQEIQNYTGKLVYDEDKEYSHIQVNFDLASKSETKPWVPLCPTNCYTLFTSKGVFASYLDLYNHNLSLLKDKDKAYAQTKLDIMNGEIRFDHVACVACGTCGVIGPKEVINFGHEKDGHGVRYRYG